MRRQTLLRIGMGWLLALVAATVIAQTTQTKNGSKDLSLELSNSATENNVGLPVYPGARPHEEGDDSSSSANIGASSGYSAFHLAVMSLETDAQPPAVESFYRKALAKYGKILECRNTSLKVKTNSGHTPKQLTCDDDQPKPGELELKAGTREEQHIVTISQEGKLTTIQLIYLLQRGVDDDKRE